ncbi:NAC domain containing protein [Parasponia andersonii]|uniref:NAC domain containing protein n=1 Tax=Parasponia andersonii TaxID=3476 RepID=A0A2P5D6N0_PARAD|nr:NAC domain containing protein [Parasponia andersonii]
MRDQSNWKATKSTSDQKVLPEKSSEDQSNWKAILRNSSEYVLSEKSSEWVLPEESSEDESRNKSSIEWVLPENIPMGYRFAPTEEELVTFYLKNRIFDKELNPVTDIKDIDEEELYSKPPKELVRFNNGDDKRQWFFFVNNHKDNNNSQSKERTVGKELGFWKKIVGDQENSLGNGGISNKGKFQGAKNIG